MSQFYARYVPPTVSKPVSTSAASSKPEKRKHYEEQIKPSESKKRRLSNDRVPSRVAEERHASLSGTHEKFSTGQGIDVLSKYSVLSAAHQKNEGAGVTLRRSISAQHSNTDGDTVATMSSQDNVESKKLKRRQKEVQEGQEMQQEVVDDQDVGLKQKHQGILSKFEKSKEQPHRILDNMREATSLDGRKIGEIELHGLEPIPQPTVAEAAATRPTYSTLPAWQADALYVSDKANPSLKSLGVNPTIIGNLKSQGIERAFPVQAAVLPLLLEGTTQHEGDLCVSAATGSGKTLAYVLPLMQDLKDSGLTRLRGVIVVPTRELVKQVRRSCDLCAAGTHLKIATAVGSKSIIDEQETLVHEEQVYDPEGYRKQENSKVDWDNFSMTSIFQSLRTEKSMKEGFVKRYTSKADILICTPGRLVDHLRSTPGFNLDHVKWLVVDEADRLLNESYQEWIDAVVPALKSRAATIKVDTILQEMRMELPRRQVRKVLLSATMTQDISKLNSIGLDNPKLVVLGADTLLKHSDGVRNDVADEDEEPIPDESGVFRLPASLVESAVTMKDGTEKPLYLLELLSKHIGISTRQEIAHDDTSSSGSDSNEADARSTSLCSTGSGSGSDSDSSSVESSDSESASSPVASLKRNHIVARPSSYSSLSPTTPRALIFTRSTSSAERLSRLLALLAPSLATHISTLTRSTASSSSSRRALSSFRSGRTTLLIATDRASRGLDVPSLGHVISYDVPSSASSYVHRVGRTARAGKQGKAWTLVEHREGKWFWDEIGGKGTEGRLRRETPIVRVNVKVEDEGLRQKYAEALTRLGEEVKGK